MNDQMKLCGICRKVKFKIGVQVKGTQERVCSTKCANKASKLNRQDAEDEQWTIEHIEEELRIGKDSL